MVDRALVLRKLSELDQYSQQLSEIAEKAIALYANDWKTQRIVDRTLQLMIETCLDIGSHIISDEGYRVPESYSDVFNILHENGIVPEDLIESLRHMAKFRNILVHHYSRIDASLIVQILGDHLDDFNRYKKSIIQYLSSLSPKKKR
jgi:uncharacterized protein YutE (UPF0331/DUF86 family)